MKALFAKSSSLKVQGLDLFTVTLMKHKYTVTVALNYVTYFHKAFPYGY